MPINAQDPDRLVILRGLGILDTGPEAAYEDVARLAAACCHSSIAAVNFVDDERHWTKAVVGVEGGQGQSVPNEVSFCAATIATEGGLLKAEDTLDDERWRDHPFVIGPPNIRFYAGASIVVSGQPIGVVCVYGDEPRELGEQEQQALEALARQASGQLELRRRNADLRDLAVTDPLTGLANRTLLFDHLELAMAGQERNGGHVGVLFCDVDGFKGVNDRWGHEAGDRLLRQIAERLRTAARDVDTVARIAGDEFVLICPGLETAEQIDVVAERVDRIVHTPSPEVDGATTPRLSIGAVLLENGETALNVLRRADAAMYQVKKGRSFLLSPD